MTDTNTPEEVQENTSFQNRIDLSSLTSGIERIKKELRKVIIGQDELIELLLISIIANGNSLIEGVPGIAKTVTAKLLARTLNIGFSRIQFTPDLMPSDILGTSIFNQRSNEFEFKKGPIFSNVILIDEINRAPAKTQAALFEVMAEKQVTIDGSTYTMSAPFIVFATQNPIEQEGTYRLPEAQLDRFLFKITIEYPEIEDEIEILSSFHKRKNENFETEINAVLNATEILALQKLAQEIIVEPNLLKYIAQIVVNTRSNPYLFLGASPRASLAILNAAKARAAMSGRDFMIPEDVKYVTLPAMRHRIIVSPEKEMEGLSADFVLNQIIYSIEIPR